MEIFVEIAFDGKATPRWKPQVLRVLFDALNAELIQGLSAYGPNVSGYFSIEPVKLKSRDTRGMVLLTTSRGNEFSNIRDDRGNIVANIQVSFDPTVEEVLSEIWYLPTALKDALIKFKSDPRFIQLLSGLNIQIEPISVSTLWSIWI